MTLRILVSGAQGKVGREIVRAVNDAQDMVLAATVDHNDDLGAAIKAHHPDAVVDFTTPDAAFTNASCIIDENVHPIIGTTGFSPEQIKTLTQRCNEQKLGGLIAPNFSLGAVLMMKYAQDAARHFNAVEILEMHHSTKKDAPSGSAIKTAEMIEQTWQTEKTTPNISASKEQKAGARGANYGGIPIHSMRLPGLVAHQAVVLGGLGETLTLRHDTTSREAFAPGVLFACRKIKNVKTLIYGLEVLLD